MLIHFIHKKCAELCGAVCLLANSAPGTSIADLYYYYYGLLFCFHKSMWLVAGHSGRPFIVQAKASRARARCTAHILRLLICACAFLVVVAIARVSLLVRCNFMCSIDAQLDVIAITFMWLRHSLRRFILKMAQAARTLFVSLSAFHLIQFL